MLSMQARQRLRSSGRKCMSVMICQECGQYIDTDFDDFDFDSETCERCNVTRTIMERFEE